MMKPVPDITGVILAGGKSSRFGSNKAMAPWRNKLLIEHIKETMEAVFSDCLLITNTPGSYAFLNLPMVQDVYLEMGPLAGIHAALNHSKTSWIFVLGCDMPAVTPELISFLCELACNDYDAVVPWTEMGPEPLCGLYRKTALEKVELQLKNGKAQVWKLLEKLSFRKVKAPELVKVTSSLHVFSNINKKEDMDNILKKVS